LFQWDRNGDPRRYQAPAPEPEGPGVWRSLQEYLRMAAAYVRINFKAQLEYRAAFVSEAVAMLMNDAIRLVFSVFFFRRFPVLGGWNFKDVLTLRAVSAGGFGIAYALMGNELGSAASSPTAN
jgi:ABC-2 type transport system permease protein